MSRPIVPRGLRFRRGIWIHVLVPLAVSFACAAQDTTPPTLVTYSFTPAAFDVSSSPTTLTGTIQATDDSAGLQSAFLAFYSPSGSRRVDCHSSLGSFSGTLLSGTFTCMGIFPQYTETGQWTLQFVSLTDKAGNTAAYQRQQLAAMGLPTTLSLSGTADLTPPALTSYSLSPLNINIGGSPVTVTGSITATDNLAGLYLAYFALYSPSGQQRVDCYALPGNPSAGTPLNGTYNCSGTFVPGMETGQWRVQFLELRDRVDNSRYYSTSDLSAMGLPTAIQVTAVTDSSAPVLTGLTLNPLSLNTSSGAAPISGVVQASDTGTGVKQAVVAMFSPSGGQRVDCASGVLTAGSLTASLSCSGLFPKNSEGGAWEVRFVTLTDQAGNVATIQKSTLAQMGLPVVVTVTGTQNQPPPGLQFSYVTGGAAPPGQQIQVLGAALPWVLEKETGSAWLDVSNAT
ncbi:MAG: Ig-like domain repeat protein, partial [Bryobacteraceae bacterium]